MAEQATNSKIYVKDGVYKVVNAVKGDVLTATWEAIGGGGGKQVITAPWDGKEEQEWKVKCNVRGGSPFYILRNEVVKNNEVSKEKNRSGEKLENKMVPVDWNIILSSNPNYFILNNGIGLLKANSPGSRICIEEGIDDDDAAHQWRFEFLHDI